MYMCWKINRQCGKSQDDLWIGAEALNARDGWNQLFIAQGYEGVSVSRTRTLHAGSDAFIPGHLRTSYFGGSGYLSVCHASRGDPAPIPPRINEATVAPWSGRGLRRAAAKMGFACC